MIRKIDTKSLTKFKNNSEKVVQNMMHEVKNNLVRSPIIEHLEVRTPKVETQYIDVKRGLFIDNLRNKLDVEGLEKNIDMDNKHERIKYICAIGERMLKQTGVDFISENTKECVSALKQAAEMLKEQLILYKKLGMTLPDEIQIVDLGYDGVRNKRSAGMNAVDTFSEETKLTTIYLDKNIFKKEFKGAHKTIIENVLENFNHEQTHSRHAKENTRLYNLLSKKGLNALLSKDEEKTMRSLEYRYYKHFKELNKNSLFDDIVSLETNLPHDNNNLKHEAGIYNMNLIGFNIKMLGMCLNSIRKKSEAGQTLSKELLEDFSPEFLKSLEPIQNKFRSIAHTICNEHLRPYAFCNPIETVAVAAEKEYAGEPLSDDMRKLLKELGAPETKHMSYLPYNHPVMVKMRETQKP